MLNIKKLADSRSGIIFVSILMGFGLSYLLKVVGDQNKRLYELPLDEKIVRHHQKCYEPQEQKVVCDPNKIIVDV